MGDVKRLRYVPQVNESETTQRKRKANRKTFTETNVLRLPVSRLTRDFRSFRLTQAIEASRLVLSQQADLWALRAWLALEHGRIDRVGRCAEKALALGGPHRSDALARLCLERIRRPAPRKK